MTKYYEILVRFPTKEMADEFCGQMSDGFGEGLCNFMPRWIQKEGTDGTNQFDFLPFTSSAPEGTRVFEVTSITQF